LRFEEQVQLALLEQFPKYRAEPQVYYFTGKGPRNAFPDGVMFLPDRTVIFEIKSQHMPEAWWQLQKHYRPVLEAFRVQPVQLIEVVKSFDLQMPFPEENIHFFSRDGLSDFLASRVGPFGVLWWK